MIRGCIDPLGGEEKQVCAWAMSFIGDSKRNRLGNSGMLSL